MERSRLERHGRCGCHGRGGRFFGKKRLPGQGVATGRLVKVLHAALGLSEIEIQNGLEGMVIQQGPTSHEQSCRLVQAFHVGKGMHALIKVHSLVNIACNGRSTTTTTTRVSFVLRIVLTRLNVLFYGRRCHVDIVVLFYHAPVQAGQNVLVGTTGGGVLTTHHVTQAGGVEEVEAAVRRVVMVFVATQRGVVQGRVRRRMTGLDGRCVGVTATEGFAKARGGLGKVVRGVERDAPRDQVQNDLLRVRGIITASLVSMLGWKDDGHLFVVRRCARQLHFRGGPVLRFGWFIGRNAAPTRSRRLMARPHTSFESIRTSCANHKKWWSERRFDSVQLKFVQRLTGVDRLSLWRLRLETVLLAVYIKYALMMPCDWADISNGAGAVRFVSFRFVRLV
eukprot:scaffold91142_cov52-Attheya_sp.AAC.1